MQQFYFTYEDIAKLVDMTPQSIYQHKTRGNLEPDDLGSVVLFLARHGHEDLRNAIVRLALAREKTEIKDVRDSIRGTKRKKRRRKK